MRCLHLLAAVALLAVALAEDDASPPQPAALGPSALSSRQAHPPALAFDASPLTYWQSASPSAGAWLAFGFPSPQTVVQYRLTASSDTRYAAADGLSAWELQAGGADGNWSVVDRRFDEPLWSPTESRLYSVRGPAPPTSAQIYRLLVVKTPGRSFDLSFASVADLRFLTSENAPSLCDALVNQGGLGAVLNLTTSATPSPSDAANGTAPNEQLLVFLNITNTGNTSLSLRGVHLPLPTSLGVQAPDGTWAAQPSTTFLPVDCWGAYLNDTQKPPPPAGLPNLCGTVTASLTPSGVLDIVLDGGGAGTRPLLLCPGCTLSGPPGGFPMLALQHKSFGRLDSEAIVAAAPAVQPLCGPSAPAAVLRLAGLPAPGVDRLPACAPWIGSSAGHSPACAPPDALTSLALKLDWSLAGGGSELHLRPRLSNTGRSSVPLFGASFAIALPGRLAADPAGPPPPHPAAEWAVECWYAAVKDASGAPPYGQRSACEYLTSTLVDAPAGGLLLNLTFLGGELCAGCTLAAGSGPDDAFLNVKRLAYEPLSAQPPPRVVGPAMCAPPLAPPATCVSGTSPPPSLR